MKKSHINLNLDDIRKAFLFAEVLLQKNEDLLNDLNVFPVPDGDTGSNMLATIKSINEKLKKEKPENLKDLENTVTEAALMGARGNSGVILSQFITGFAQGLKGKDEDEIDTASLGKAALTARDAAYKSVHDPKEGTILTVIKKSMEEFDYQARRGKAPRYIFQQSLNKAKETLKDTPDFLPVLKEAGVVDAGGAGFVFFLEAFRQALLLKTKGLDTNQVLEDLRSKTSINVGEIKQEPKLNFKRLFFIFRLHLSYFIIRKNIIFLSRKLLGLPSLVYKFSLNRLKMLPFFPKLETKNCLEVLIKNINTDPDRVKEDLSQMGDSLIIGGNSKLLKIHVHTNQVREILTYLNNLGEIRKKRFSTLEKDEEKLNRPQAEEKIALAAVSHGEGFKNILESMKVKVIDGGQTMNPSVEKLLDEIEGLPENEIILFPSNKNIFMAAERASKISFKNIQLVHSESIPHTLSALVSFNPEKSGQENAEEMEKVFDQSTLIKIGRAIRDTSSGGLKVKKGNFIAIKDDEEIASANPEMAKTILETIDKIFSPAYSIISFYRGQKINLENDEQFKNQLIKKYPGVELQFYQGDQPHYPYLILLEE